MTTSEKEDEEAWTPHEVVKTISVKNHSLIFELHTCTCILLIQVYVRKRSIKYIPIYVQTLYQFYSYTATCK